MDEGWVVNWQELIMAVGGAALLGFFYFGGLWLTVQRIVRIEREPATRIWWRQPALIAAFSFLVRTGLVVAGLYVVTGGKLVPLLVAMGVFVAMRTLLLQAIIPLPTNAG